MVSIVSTDMRNSNRRLIFDTVRKMREVTRVDLSKVTGMSGPSILKIVDELVNKKVLIPIGETGNSVGRKSLLLKFNPDVILTIGVEFEGDHLSIGVVNLDGEIKLQTVSSIPHAFDENFTKSVVKGIEKIKRQLAQQGCTALGIGVGIPGVVDIENEVIEFAPLIGITQPTNAKPFVEGVANATGLPVFLENDVNAATLGEVYARQMDNESDILYVSIGTGLGAGLILEGKLRRGAHNLGGEIGYSVFESSYVTDRSHGGWLESQLNLDALNGMFGYNQNNREIPEGMIDYISDKLSPFLANMATLLDIDLIVLGGVLVEHTGDLLIDAIDKKVKRLAVCPVKVCKHVSEAPGITGSAIIAAHNLLDHVILS